jgi:hypothetical protein
MQESVGTIAFSRVLFLSRVSQTGISQTVIFKPKESP